MAEFELGGHHYRIGRLNAFDCNHVARKLTPALIFLSSLRTYAEKEKVELPGPDAQAKALCSLCSEIDNADLDQAFAKCLGVVMRDTGGGRGFVPITAGGTAVLMHEDIDMHQMLQIVLRVLDEHRLIDFFADLPSVSAAGVGK